MKYDFRLITVMCLVLSDLHGEPRGGGLFDQILPWLPKDVEVVYSSNIAVSPNDSKYPMDIQNFAQLASIEARETVSGEAKAVLHGFSARPAVYAGRKLQILQPVEGLGLGSKFHGCSFLGAPATEIQSVAANLASLDVEVTIEGRRLYRLDSKAVEKEVSFLAAPAPNVFMVCSDSVLAKEVLRGISGLPTGGQLREALAAGWADQSASVWGLRVFPRSEPPDPWSPLHEDLPVLKYHDPGARALAFALTGERGMITYFTQSNSEIGSMYSAIWKKRATEKSQGPYRALEFKVSLTAKEIDDDFTRVLLFLLGRVMVV